MQPLAFDGLFGWLHRQSGPSQDTGVLLISPLGRDARCAHRPMRLFADQLAQAGFPTLRYDHRGCGDSLDLTDASGDALAAWRADIEQAVATLRARTGVSRVVLGGVRLGATLAALSADQADGLILLAPVLNGRSWLRRLRFSADVASARLQAGVHAPLDAEGLYLSAETVASLSQIDLSAMALTPVAVFVAAQNKLVEAYAQALSVGGAPVRSTGFSGFRELFLDAHSNLPPLAVFDQAAQWLRANFGDLALTAALAAPPAPELRPPGAVERPVAFGVGLHGVLCQPEAPVEAGTAVLFCNTGGDPRAGIGGFATKAARELALRGVASLRFDFAGLGDSRQGDETTRCHVYETSREADMDAALAFLADQGAQTITVVGVCAGAYHALHASWRAPQVKGVFAVSPVKLVWRGGDSLIFGRKDDGKATRVYARAATRLQTWKRLLKGEIDVLAVSHTLAARLKGRAQGVTWTRTAGSPSSELERFLRRGGRACLIMGLDDGSLDEVETYLGPRGSRLSRIHGGSVKILPRLDHGLAREESRQITLESLLNWLGLDQAKGQGRPQSA